MTDLIHPSGAVVHMAGERLNLTDMWRASGADPARKPAKWREQDATKAFVDYLTETIPQKDSSLFEVKEGRNGGTWAHWQIGLAYAKYLSPAFHAWANGVVRERMEGKAVPADETIRRIDGINRMLAHKVTGMEKELSELTAAVRSLVITHDPRLAAIDAVPALKVAMDNGVPKKGRRPVVKAISDSLSRYCAERGIAVRRDVRETKLFPVGAVYDWLRNGGSASIRKLVAEQVTAGPLFDVIPGGKSA